jgi:hypothetical protein
MAESGSVLKVYYSGLNAQQRAVYLNRALYDKNFAVGVINESGANTTLIETYPVKWVKAKIDTVNLLSLFGSRLVALAGSTAPEDITTGINTLGANLITLGDQIEGISISEKEKMFAADVTSIVASLGGMYLDKKRDEMIKQALEVGYPAAMKALDYIEEDLPVIGAIQSSGANLSLMSQVNYFNDKYAGKDLPLSEKRVVIDDISKSAGNISALYANRPDALVSAMREALMAVADYAKNPQAEDSLVRLTSAIETFNNRVAPIAESIKRLRG